jgi:hypothetical protein
MTLCYKKVGGHAENEYRLIPAVGSSPAYAPAEIHGDAIKKEERSQGHGSEASRRI